MPTTLALWHAEHVNFARLLNVLDGQLVLFHGGKVPDYELMLNIMFYMTHYSDVLHHPKEDLVFAKIREREMGVAATVDKLAAQHARLHDAGRELVRQLEDIVNGRSRRAKPSRPLPATMSARCAAMRLEREILPLADSCSPEVTGSDPRCDRAHRGPAVRQGYRSSLRRAQPADCPTGARAFRRRTSARLSCGRAVTNASTWSAWTDPS
jgi:hypothetical protein